MGGCQVESTSKILQKQKSETIAIEETNSNTTAIAIDDREIDLVLEDYQNIICKEFTGWYAKTIKQIGKDRFILLAKTAEQEGANPARYFSWLLKRELK